MVRSTCSLAIALALTGCFADEESLGSTPLFASCVVPDITSETAPITACGSGLGDVARVYPTAAEDRFASCRLRYPDRAWLTQPEQYPMAASNLCPRGLLVLVRGYDELVILESQPLGENPGYFVHALTRHDDAPHTRYGSTRFVAWDYPFSLVPIDGTFYEPQFLFLGSISWFNGQQIETRVRFPTIHGGTPETAAPTHEFGGHRDDGFVIAESGYSPAVTRVQLDGSVVYTWEDPAESYYTSYLAIATGFNNEAAILSSADGNTSLIVLEADGTLRFRVRLPKLRDSAVVRFLDNEIFVLGTTDVYIGSLSGSEQVIYEDIAWPDHDLAARYDARTGCPTSLHLSRTPGVERAPPYRPLIEVGFSHIAYGFDSGARNTFNELVLADTKGRKCDSVTLHDDDEVYPLTQIVEMYEGVLAATDASDVWVVERD